MREDAGAVGDAVVSAEPLERDVVLHLGDAIEEILVARLAERRRVPVVRVLRVGCGERAACLAIGRREIRVHLSEHALEVVAPVPRAERRDGRGLGAGGEGGLRDLHRREHTTDRLPRRRTTRLA
jgi:hypothetical protein